MKYQIDQSGKIEQTNWPTVVAIANGKSLTVKISSVEKQKLIQVLIRLDKPRKNYTLKIFSALIAILLIRIKPQMIIIDNEYDGHNADIKNMLLNFCQKLNIKTPNISFHSVGKKCKAHFEGNAVFCKKKEADIKVKAKDLLKIIISNKKTGWRPHSRRGNP